MRIKFESQIQDETDHQIVYEVGTNELQICNRKVSKWRPMLLHRNTKVVHAGLRGVSFKMARWVLTNCEVNENFHKMNHENNLWQRSHRFQSTKHLAYIFDMFGHVPSYFFHVQAAVTARRNLQGSSFRPAIHD